jgi:C-terminal processing protease CtpA/Prc
MDMRGYPKGTAWQITPRIATKQDAVLAQWQRRLITASGALSFTTETRVRDLGAFTGEKYQGRTVLLIDESAGSQAEHTGLMFRAANNTVFIGTPTMGINGDVTHFVVPGGIRISFSGQGVRHGDGIQLQRIGLRPDVEVHRTIRGIRAGHDEILDRAIKYLSLE